MKIESFLGPLLLSPSNSFGLFEIVLACVIPFLISFGITSIYRLTSRTLNYSVSFIHSIFLFSALSSILTLIIGNNIARAFGLVGALSIIRFRNALKSPLDAVYIFWALAVGMACGTGCFLAAFTFSFLCGAMALTLHYSGYGVAHQKDEVLKISFDGENLGQQTPLIEKAIANYTKKFKSLSQLEESSPNKFTLVYLLRARKEANFQETKKILENVSGIQKVLHLRTSIPEYS